MGATTRYGFRFPASTAASTIWTWIQNLAEDIEGRLATVEDTGGGIARLTAAQSLTNKTISGPSAAFAGDVSGGHFRFGNSGNEIIMGAESPTVMTILNPGASLWATVKAGTFAEQSSRRFKEKIRATRYGLADILALRPVDYHYKASPDIPQTGLIAEEVAGIYPEAVTLDEDGQPDGIDYSKLAPVLIRAIQQLEERVRVLERAR